MYAWGYNGNGELGDGMNANSSTPVKVRGGDSGSTYLSNIVTVSGSYASSYALRSDGSVWSWGNNGNGQLGNGTTGSTLLPKRVAGGASGAIHLRGVVDISSGAYSGYALTAAGKVYSWGYNGYGNLGDGTTVQRNTPVLVKFDALDLDPGYGFSSIGSGNYHGIAIGVDGAAYAWGYNGYGNGNIGDGY